MPDLGSLGLSNITGMFGKINFLPLVVVVVVIFVVGFLFLFILKRKSLVFPSAEIVDLGSGKTCINCLGKKSAGWLGKKKGFMRLWYTGDKVMRLKSGEIVEEFSEEDFQEVNARRGIIFYRDPVSRLLFPISRLRVTNRELVASIAPAVYTDTAVEIIRANEVETRDKWKELAPMLVMAGVIVFAIISMILIYQLFKHDISEGKDLILKAGSICLESAKAVCSQMGLPSVAP